MSNVPRDVHLDDPPQSQNIHIRPISYPALLQYIVPVRRWKLRRTSRLEDITHSLQHSVTILVRAVEGDGVLDNKLKDVLHHRADKTRVEPTKQTVANSTSVIAARFTPGVFP